MPLSFRRCASASLALSLLACAGDNFAPTPAATGGSAGGGATATGGGTAGTGGGGASGNGAGGNAGGSSSGGFAGAAGGAGSAGGAGNGGDAGSITAGAAGQAGSTTVGGAAGDGGDGGSGGGQAGSAGANNGGNAGANIGGNAGANIGGNAGASIGGNAGANIGGNAGASIGGNAGANIGGNAGANIGGNAGANNGGNAGASIGGSGGAAGLGGAGGNAGAGAGAGAGQAGAGGGSCGAGTNVCVGKQLRDCQGTPLRTCSAHEICDPAGECLRPTKLFAGPRQACAIIGDGSAVCWGADADGQLGRGSVEAIVPRSPGRVLLAGGSAPLKEIRHLVLNDRSTCAVVGPKGGPFSVLCWGNDSLGQLGDGPEDSSRSAVDPAKPVLLPEAARKLRPRSIASSGATSCVVTGEAKGAGYCWGAGAHGQLGHNASPAFEPSPVKVITLEDAESIAVGATHACATDAISNGLKRIQCWGAQDTGQLGNNVVMNTAQPYPQSVLDPVDPDNGYGAPRGSVLAAAGAIAAPGMTLTGLTCSLFQGKADCWGWNQFGQLGDNAANTRALPAAVVSAVPFTALSAAPDHVCALTASDARCWGSNASHQLGEAFQGEVSRVPVVVANALDVAAGGFIESANANAVTRGFTCVLAADTGAITCFGDNSSGQLGGGGAVQKNIVAMP